ncbi:hypothetical protein [Ramlibacter sp.]|nr:hypothetical protein [Ramlibacter sp.]
MQVAAAVNITITAPEACQVAAISTTPIYSHVAGPLLGLPASS